MVFTENIYPKICARVRVALDGVKLLTFAIVFPVPGGSAEHNLFGQPILIWFFTFMEMRETTGKDGRPKSSADTKPEHVPPPSG